MSIPHLPEPRLQELRLPESRATESRAPEFRAPESTMIDMSQQSDAVLHAVPNVDLDKCVHLLLDLLRIPSPTGFTEEATAYVASFLSDLGVPFERTPKGALLWHLAATEPVVPVVNAVSNARSVAVHIDTLGAMVREVKANGRLRLTAIGGYKWATVEGEYCKIHTMSGKVYTGTVVNVKQSSHLYGQELEKLERNDRTLEIRIDEETHSREETLNLGINVGDFISWDSRPEETDSGFIKGRHLDNKASVAIALAVTESLIKSGTRPATDMHFFLSNYEEVGHGAATGIPTDTTELLCIDMAVIGDGQQGSEYDVTLCAKDSSGPYDYAMKQRLNKLAADNDISLKTDIYPYYGSDASAAWRAGGNFPAALIGPGVDASHAYERTHRKSLKATADLLLAYCLSN